MHRIRGTLSYANIISTLCLVLLVGGGTAFAAKQMLPKNSVGAKQIKNGAITPAKLSTASKSRLTGPAGPRGATGATGPKGDQGSQGIQGNPGTSALDRLPSGKTLVGGGLLSTSATSAGETVRNYLNFPVRLPQPISEEPPRQMFFGTNVPVSSSTFAAGEQDARCAGSAEAPSAPAGLLCVYPSGTTNISGLAVRAGTLGIGDELANEDGFYVFGSSVAIGDTVVRYTWAYTAP